MDCVQYEMKFRYIDEGRTKKMSGPHWKRNRKRMNVSVWNKYVLDTSNTLGIFLPTFNTEPFTAHYILGSQFLLHGSILNKIM